MSKITHFKDFSVVDGDVRINVPFSKYNDAFQKAQFELDTMVMHSMEPFMPMDTGSFIALTKARSMAMAGTGKVCAGAAPMGRFLYMGKVMVDPETGSPWARKGVRKVVTDRPLVFDKTAHPNAQPFWFDAAKKKDGEAWDKKVEKIIGEADI